MTLLGLISDTHGLLRPQAKAALADVQHIVHAGDIGSPEVLDQLRAIAPLTVVRGNVDYGRWADGIPFHAEICIDGYNIYAVHNPNDVDIDPEAAGVAAVICGHTHRPIIESRGGVLYINPGSAGPRRFSLPVSLGFLRLVVNGAPEAWLRTLEI